MTRSLLTAAANTCIALTALLCTTPPRVRLTELRALADEATLLTEQASSPWLFSAYDAHSSDAPFALTAPLSSGAIQAQIPTADDPAVVLAAAAAAARIRPQPPPAPASPIRLFVTLVWEGRDLQDFNLEALRRFRDQFAGIQVVHFVSPAYFTHPGADAARVKQALRSVMRPGDKLGVEIAAWHSVVERAGVIFRGSPTFWGYEMRAADCKVDCGSDVPLNVYPQAEVARIARASLDILQAQGFGRPAATLTAGWVATPQVLDAYAQNDVRYDFSAVAPELLARRLAGFPLYQWVRGLWPSVTPSTQPYVLPSVATGLTEIPQSLAAADYLLGKDLPAIFKEYVERLRREPNRDLTFQIALYQETARQMLPIVTSSLQSIFAYATEQSISLQPFDVPGLDIPADPTVVQAQPLVH
jgi:hypothetical protein